VGIQNKLTVGIMVFVAIMQVMEFTITALPRLITPG
jgi:flagellar biosynthesis protein FliQ